MQTHSILDASAQEGPNARPLLLHVSSDQHYRADWIIDGLQGCRRSSLKLRGHLRLDPQMLPVACREGRGEQPGRNDSRRNEWEVFRVGRELKGMKP